MSAISNKLLTQIKMTALLAKSLTIRFCLQQKFPATRSNHRLSASIYTTQLLIRCWNGCAVIYGVERFEKWSIAVFGQKEVPMSREIRKQRVGDGSGKGKFTFPSKVHFSVMSTFSVYYPQC